MKRVSNLALTMVMSMLLIAFAYFAYQGHRTVTLTGGSDVVIRAGVLPYYAFRSLLRMLGAYLLSFIFTLVYGYHAGTNKRAEKWLIPILDILQSVPILGFFPAAVFFFVSLFKGHMIGVELASIFLIFTSQAWNMTFGFYESLTTIPKDLIEVASGYRVNGWRRFKKLYFPAGIPKLVYNSILSWAGGWYFLIAAEIIAIGPVKYSLPGLGSYLIKTTEDGALGLTLLGLATLVALITLMNIFIWQPLSSWAENFKYEVDSGGGSKRPELTWGYRLWTQAPGFRELGRLALAGGEALGAVFGKIGWRIGEIMDESPWLRSAAQWLWRIIIWGLALLLFYAMARGVLALGTLFLKPLSRDIYNIPLAILYSVLRLACAYLLSLVWTVPVAIWVGSNERVSNFLTPVFEILASVPATALFPFIVFLLVGVTGGMNVAAVVLVLTGMQWYLLFNLIAGVRSIPRDLKQAAEVFGLKGFQYLRRVVFPALMPSLITGSITAWGGGWNALIVAEYVTYAGRNYSAFGIGSLLDSATYHSGNFQLIWSSLLAMMITIVLMNRLIWRRLYETVSRKFKIEV